MPLWCIRPPADNDRYQYFLGEAVAAPSSAEGVFGATIDALSRLAQKDFPEAGIMPGQLPGDVRFYGVEQLQIYKVRDAAKGLYDIRVLYRYSHESLEAERHRREVAAARKKAGGAQPSAPAARGRLKLVLDHSDALIIVNGAPLAVSTAGEPLELEVPSGRYIDAEFTQYESIRAIRRFYIPPGQAEIRDVHLVDRPGFITVSATQDGVTVDLDEGTSVALPTTEKIHLSPGKHSLVFQKKGFLSTTVKIVVVRDKTTDVPKVTLESATAKLERLGDPPWVLEVSPIGNSAGSLKFPAVGAYTYGAAIDRRIVGPVRVKVGYFRGSGQNTEQNPTDLLGNPIVTDTISSSYLEVSLPVETVRLSPYQRFYLEPLWAQASQNVGGLNVNGQFTQQGVGLAIDFRQFFEPNEDSWVVFGFGARVAVTDYYQTTGGLTGKLALSIRFIDILIGI